MLKILFAEADNAFVSRNVLIEAVTTTTTKKKTVTFKKILRGRHEK